MQGARPDLLLIDDKDPVMVFLRAKCFAEVRDRFVIQSCLVEGFVAGFCQLLQTPKLIQQASALELADADDLVQL